MLSDELLRHLMAAGQVDVLVGVPTLNNAATVGHVVSAVHLAFARHFPRDRTLLVNADGGSEDGTTDVVRGYSIDDTETLTMTYSLRTTHRISAPYHGVPGKGSALRQILTAADLTQAKAVAVLDAEVTSVTPDWIASLIRPVRDQGLDYVAPIYTRHPLDGPLVTQIIRPLMRAAFGRRIHEPLAAEFGCSSRFLSHCLEEDIWDSELARYGIDLWITAAALGEDFRCAEAPLGPRIATPSPTRPGIAEVFQQVVGSAFGCLDGDAKTWLTRTGSEALPTTALPLDSGVERPHVDAGRLTETFRSDLDSLRSVLESIVTPETLARLDAVAAAPAPLRFPDDLWVDTVYEFLLAHHRGVMRKDHIAQALMPLYLGRAGSFLDEFAERSETDTDAALESLCRQFEERKPDLVQRWDQATQR